MLNLKIVPVEKKMTVEEKLVMMKQLDAQIKELAAHKDMLKDEVIVEHFSSCIEYRTSKGLLLATYKQIISNRFQTKEFEADYPELASEYKKETVSYTFLLK